MKDRQPPLYLITGIIIGLLAGVLISKVILPVRYTDVSPNTLSADQKEVYRALIGRAYLYEGDRSRAFTRLALLGDENLGDILVSQAQQMVAASQDTLSARGLALLASALTNPNAVITPLAAQVSGATDEPNVTGTPSASKTPIPPTATPFATYTPRPTATAKPTQGAPYQLVGEPKEVCGLESDTPLLMVYVYDSAGNGIGGVQIELSVTDGGSSSFFTGLYPEISSGYADYAMMPGVTYSLRVGLGGDILSGLATPQCTASDGSTYAGSLELKFKQP
jgi:hypothetical protein